MILGKALYERQFLDMPFTKIMYKLILGLDVGIDDLKEVRRGRRIKFLFTQSNPFCLALSPALHIVGRRNATQEPVLDDGQRRYGRDIRDVQRHYR